MSQAVPSNLPAGWYPDPATYGQQRYWDGAQWTNHTAPIAMRTSETSVYALLAIIMAFTFPPLGIVFGVMGRREIDRSGGAKTGRGLATAGFWVSIAACVFYGAYILIFIVLFIAGAANSNGALILGLG
jgi:hypothetical protein